MLKLKNIYKTYKTGSFEQKALDNVSISFRSNEFVAILGQSGSGKTTLLNIIGGLDRYDKGDMIINNKSTKKFKTKSWDSYRNNCVGFVFQSYNLISHINILDNVEMALTLSGISKNKRRKKAKEALKKVGLLDHAHKKPNQLSGGQMQRVAIARALVNNPEIILADEPTGALDSKTSVQIMNLIKEISKNKLVIMVTHNPELAKEYASRIIEIKDGKVINDSNPLDENSDDSEIKIKKTSMSFMQALKLSFNNIRTKKGRTLLTAFASSIGIIGIALILALSNGFNIQIEKFENDTLSTLPIVISKQTMNLDPENIEKISDNMSGKTNNLEDFTKKEEVYPFDIEESLSLYQNKLTDTFIEYINRIDKNLHTGITVSKAVGLSTFVKNGDKVSQVDFTRYYTSIPENNGNNSGYINTFYDLIYGEYPKNKEDLVLIVDSKNRIPSSLLQQLGYNKSDSVKFEDLINKEIKLVFNDDLYKKYDSYYVMNSNLEDLYNSDSAVTLKITGIIRGKEDKENIVGTSMGISYSEKLVDYTISKNKNSKIVVDQINKDYNLLTGAKFEKDEDKKTILNYLGDEQEPTYIYIYPKDFESKEEIITYLDDYNKKVVEEDKIIYTDQAKIITSLSSSIMDAITIVLIAFSSISLVVSSIMIGIITYISVLERTKEIGILRSLGARGKDISRVFTAEVFIIGLVSGLIGLGIARILCIPANSIIKSLTDLDNVARLSLDHSLILLTISIILTLIGGAIPARIASKKDPVEALRVE